MFLTESKIVYLPQVKAENMDYEKLVYDLDLGSEMICENYSFKGQRKKMRLHQLTWEEKMQRKKLRNRIAAQTSRDRKKAKMDYLEETVKELKHQNELLLFQVEELKKKNEVLLDANVELQKALAQRSYTCSCLPKIEEDIENIPYFDKAKEQICVEDGFSTERPAESCEIPQQKESCPTLAQVLADFRGNSFFDDLERLAASLLEEVEQNESKRDTEPLFKEISGSGKQKYLYNIEMVGKTSEKVDSSGGEFTCSLKDQQHFPQSVKLTTEEKIELISVEHSYASFKGSNFFDIQFPKTNSQNDTSNIPLITITESEKISAIEKELKKDIEFETVCSKPETSDILSVFSDHCSPRSDTSCDQGYDSVGSPNQSELSVTDNLNEFDELWENSVLELFPELI